MQTVCFMCLGLEISSLRFLLPHQYKGSEWNVACGPHSIDNSNMYIQTVSPSTGVFVVQNLIEITARTAFNCWGRSFWCNNFKTNFFHIYCICGLNSVQCTKCTVFMEKVIYILILVVFFKLSTLILHCQQIWNQRLSRMCLFLGSVCIGTCI